MRENRADLRVGSDEIRSVVHAICNTREPFNTLAVEISYMPVLIGFLGVQSNVQALDFLLTQNHLKFNKYVTLHI